MSYIEQNLTTNEKILHQATISNIYVFIGPIMAGIGGLLGGAMVAIGADELGPGLMVAFLVLCLGIPSLVAGLIMKFTTEVALTNQRVILKWGLIQRNTIEIILEKVEGLSADQDILGRLFNYGSITVRGTGSGNTPCPGIEKPLDFRRAVNEEIQKLGQAKAGSASGTGTSQRRAQQAARPAIYLPPGSASGVQFHVTNNGQQFGPFPVSVLQQMVSARTFTAASLVWHPGLTDWHPAASVPELAGLFASAAPPPAPPPPPPVSATTTPNEPRATCIHCSARAAFPPDMVGQEVPCPTCSNPLLLVES